MSSRVSDFLRNCWPHCLLASVAIWEGVKALRAPLETADSYEIAAALRGQLIGAVGLCYIGILLVQLFRPQRLSSS